MIISGINWLYHQLITLNLNQCKIGVAQLGLSVQKLNSVLMPLSPLAEQQTIVTQIEALEANIAQAQMVIDDSKSLKEAVLKFYLS